VSKTTKIIIGVIVAIAVVATAITVFALQPRDSVSDSVLTENVERRDVTTTVAASGVVEAIDQRAVSFKQFGELASVEVSVGDVVSEGDVLATLDPSDLEAALVQARSALESARGGITAAAQGEASAQTGINSADQQLTRAEQSVKASRGQSREERDNANRELAVAQANRDAAELSMQVAREGRVQADLALQAARASFEQAEKALEETTLLAPISGTVISIASKVGEQIGSTSPASGTGGGFMVIADLSAFVVTADFAEADVVGIEEGQEVSVTFDAIPGGGVTGTVIEAGLFGGVDPAGGRLTTYEVTISIPSPPQGLRVGMTAQASITTESRPDVLAAPVTALVERDGATFVQVLGADGNITLVEVTVGIQGGYWIEITSGLSGGERVVTGASGDIPVVGGGGFGPPEGTPGGDE
jgi:membrane fusion protein, macrolide-specific efflux system